MLVGPANGGCLNYSRLKATIRRALWGFHDSQEGVMAPFISRMRFVLCITRNGWVDVSECLHT